MRKITTVTAYTLAAMTLAAGAYAQSNSATSAPATHNMTSTIAANGNSGSPSDRNPVLTDNGDARASKVIGSSVYNDNNQKVGTIDDIVIPKQGGQVEAVLSVGGFLGIGSKYVEVPYSQLKFGNTKANSDNQVVLTGATKDSLMQMGSFNYTHS
jgi:sporulation protein YlmC with PRC-barrel domain